MSSENLILAIITLGSEDTRFVGDLGQVMKTEIYALLAIESFFGMPSPHYCQFSHGRGFWYICNADLGQLQMIRELPRGNENNRNMPFQLLISKIL